MGKKHRSEHRVKRDLEFTRHRAAEVSSVALELSRTCHERPQLREQCGPCGGERDAPRPHAMQQPHSHDVLELGDRHRYRRLGDGQLGGGRGDGAVVGDGDEVLHLAQSHPHNQI